MYIGLAPHPYINWPATKGLKKPDEMTGSERRKERRKRSNRRKEMGFEGIGIPINITLKLGAAAIMETPVATIQDNSTTHLI